MTDKTDCLTLRTCAHGVMTKAGIKFWE